ncbi:MAG: AI-2E family transporter [Alphaproteobacteria bacterium]|nr:AI-2E family transporter [Alphaproteobacteria bacterium]
MECNSGSAAPRDEAERAAAFQRIARVVLVVALVLLGTWILRRFLPALAWAGVLAIALWPLNHRLGRAGSGQQNGVLAAFLLTVAIGLIFAAPFVYVLVEGAREIRVVIHFLGEAQRNGIAVPDRVQQLPLVGHTLAEWWRSNLSDPAAARELLGRVNTRSLAASAREYGPEITHRLILFGFTLLTLFFLFRDGTRFSRQLIRLSDRLLGPDGERIGRHMVQAVLATVTGLVLVGLGEGAVMGVAYIAAGLSHPVSVAALTGVLAVIPFGAPVAFGAAALYLAGTGSTVAGVAVFCFGLAVVFVADHVIRPLIIGGSARLPFLWVLLGILGGLESFGIIGLFLGPAVMAALISLWREWTDNPAPDDRRRGFSPSSEP